MRKIFIIIAAVAGVVVIASCSLGLGRFPVPFADVVAALTGGDIPEACRTVLFQIRLPRIAAAILVGAAMAAAGASYQSMFVNPLVSPGILGVLAGAGFGAAFGMLISDSWFCVQVMAFGFGLLAASVSVCIARFYGGDRVLMLILGGIITSSMFTALLSAVKYLADPADELPAITYWLMGSLTMVDPGSVAAVSPMIIAGVIVMCLCAGRLNLLSMGDDEARTMGVNPRRSRLLIVIAATVTCVAAVSISGIIGWIGLLTPHIGRMLIGPDNRFLIPFSALTGAILLLLADNLSRLFLPVELPLGITTSLFGIPFFAFCLKRARRKW